MDYNNNTNPYTQPNNNYYSNGQNQFIRNPGQTMATVSLILGIVSIFTIFTVYIPLICGSLAIILAILSKGYGKKMLGIAKAGITTGIVGITLIITVIVIVISSLLNLISTLSAEEMIEFGRQFDEQFEQQTGQEIEDVAGTSYEEIMKMYAELLGK